MTDWKRRLTGTLEPLLRQTDPRPSISAYHDMPYAIFHYAPSAEWELRAEVRMLATRLHADAGKRVTEISLAECLTTALERSGLSVDKLVEAERKTNPEKIRDTLHAVVGRRQPLDRLILERIPADADPQRDIAFITRVGSMFPFYRTSNLTEHMMGKIHIPVVLFYPGHLDGPASLVFMGVTSDVNPSYRPRIF